jgi:probable rRNA maturation factor
MILLDPDLEPESPHGQRPVHGDPTAKVIAAKRTVAPGIPTAKKDISLPSARTLGRFLSAAQEAVRLKGQVTVLLTTDAAIAKLNRQFRGKNKATDVLSFPAAGLGAEGISGDVAISVTTAMKQAREQGHSLSTEIKVLILHGLLHLAGYDHEADDGKMARRERLLRGRLRLPQGLIERAGAGDKGAKKASEKHPSGAKARVRIAPFMARLKSCPFKANARPFKAKARPFERESRIFETGLRPFKSPIKAARP